MREVFVEDVVDFPPGDEEGDIAREQYRINDHVLEFVELMKKGVTFPPIILSKTGHLIDGMHRLTAYKLLGRKKIKFVYWGEHE